MSYVPLIIVDYGRGLTSLSVPGSESVLRQRHCATCQESREVKTWPHPQRACVLVGGTGMRLRVLGLWRQKSVRIRVQPLTL